MPALYRFSLGDVCVDDFIAYTPYYQSAIPQNMRKPFYVAKVIALKDTAVQVQTYITGTKGLSLLNTSLPVKYKTYQGPNKVQDVAAEDIITVCELTPSNALKASSKRKLLPLLDEKILHAKKQKIKSSVPAAGRKTRKQEDARASLCGDGAVNEKKDAAAAKKATVVKKKPPSELKKEPPSELKKEPPSELKKEPPSELKNSQYAVVNGNHRICTLKQIVPATHQKQLHSVTLIHHDPDMNPEVPPAKLPSVELLPTGVPPAEATPAELPTAQLPPAIEIQMDNGPSESKVPWYRQYAAMMDL